MGSSEPKAQVSLPEAKPLARQRGLMNSDGEQKYPSSINDSSHPNENATSGAVESVEAQSISVDGPLLMNRTLSTPATASGEELKQDYPLSLQRSASSAFGRFATNRTRTFSNSGSDTGSTGSAFHPVWSYRSVTSASSICSSSETGSNVSSIVKSAHSDPTTGTGEGRSRFSSPWRKVMNKMKNSSSNKAGGFPQIDRCGLPVNTSLST